VRGILDNLRCLIAIVRCLKNNYLTSLCCMAHFSYMLQDSGLTFYMPDFDCCFSHSTGFFCALQISDYIPKSIKYVLKSSKIILKPSIFLDFIIQIECVRRLKSEKRNNLIFFPLHASSVDVLKVY